MMQTSVWRWHHLGRAKWQLGEALVAGKWRVGRRPAGM